MYSFLFKFIFILYYHLGYIYIYSFFFQSRACLSLLAYCYFYTQDFVKAANCYEELTVLFPEELDYELYYAQSLYQACLYQEALKVTAKIDDPDYYARVSTMNELLHY